MRVFRLCKIRAISDKTYEVTLGHDVERAAFDMTIDDADGIDVVTYGDDFSNFVSHNTGPLGPVLKAVLEFHLGTAVAIPVPS